jgi:protein SCO1/2
MKILAFLAIVLVALAPPATAQETETFTPDRIPDAALVDQDGRKVQFYTDLVAGKVVVVNFIFTTCTTICPPMGASFGKLQKSLGERAGRDVHLISLSIDPLTDTPPRLLAWAEKFGRTPGWTLVTGPRAEINAILRALGAYVGNKLDHAPIALVGRDGGEWLRVSGLANPEKVIAAIDRVAHGAAGPAAAEE